MNVRLAFAIAGLVSTCAYSQISQIPAAVNSSANTSSATVQATCSDGTAATSKSLRHACRGHGGIAKTAVPPGASTMGAAPAPASTSPAASSAGKVWANGRSKVYHCPGDPYYGKTKKGEYMSEADAKSKGFHADHGKVCTS
jgi:hypothetical protein